MTKRMNRRVFLKNSTIICASTILTGNLISTGGKRLSTINSENKIDISVGVGEDYFNCTLNAVKQQGGMKCFVSNQSKVAILANAQRNNPGTFTNPDILRAVIRMCKEAGAKEINCLSWQPEKNWENTGLKKVIEQEGANLIIVNLKDETLFKPISIAKGKSLKKCRIMKPFFQHNTFINIPITKDHAGNKFTGTLKNLMGLNSPQNNRTFHKKSWRTDINSINHLDQCIADLNTVIKPDLNIVDATEFIITNGPFGPGKLLKPNQVVVGTDRVAVDSYCCQLWGLETKEIIMINQAYKHGLGEINLKKVSINKISG